MVSPDWPKVVDAYKRWRELTNSPSNGNSARKFLYFLNTGQYVDNVSKEEFYITPEVQHKLDWLNGPYAHTMYKIWEAQNGAMTNG